MPKQGDRLQVRVEKDFRLYKVPRGKYVDYELEGGIPYADYIVGQVLLLVWTTIGPPTPSWLMLGKVPETGNPITAVISSDVYDRLLSMGTIVKL